MDTSHQEKYGVNTLSVFFSPHRRNIHPNVRYATVTHVYYVFWFFQSPTGETPAWILTLSTPNDVVLRKEENFEGYKNEISYLTEFWWKFEIINIVSMGKYLNCHNSGCVQDRVVIVGSTVWFSGSANSTMPVTFVSDRPLLPWQRKFAIFNTKLAITQFVPEIRPRCLHLLGGFRDRPI